MSKKEFSVLLMLAVYFVLIPVVYFMLGGINTILPAVIAASAVALYMSLKQLQVLD